MKHFFYSLVVILYMLSSCNTDPHTYALIQTDKGDIKVKLYNDTPQHKENFIKLANEGYYDDLLFHRVMQGFMIQGGDPNSKGAPPNKQLGAGGPGYTIPAEFGHLHYKGALAAAHNGNPQKSSSGSQFYLVQGRAVDDKMLDNFARQKNIKYSEAQREKYKKLGGAPFLDMGYTVFGQVVEGMEVIDSIAAVPTKPGDRPIQDVKMKVRILD